MLFSQEDHFCNYTMNEELFIPHEQNIADTCCDIYIRYETFLETKKDQLQTSKSATIFAGPCCAGYKDIGYGISYLISSAEKYPKYVEFSNVHS